MLILDVPYVQKDEAKALGARWNPEIKKWVVYEENYQDLFKFRKWVNGSIIIQNDIYIVEGMRKCWKCKGTTSVICLAFKDYIDMDSQKKMEGRFRFVNFLSSLPAEVLEYMKTKYNFKYTYSRTIKSKYWANCCEHCDNLQGIFYLFEEPSSPFDVYSKEKAEALTFYRISLPYSLVTDLDDVYPCMITPKGNLVESYSTFKDLNLFNQVN